MCRNAHFPHEYLDCRMIWVRSVGRGRAEDSWRRVPGSERVRCDLRQTEELFSLEGARVVLRGPMSAGVLPPQFLTTMAHLVQLHKTLAQTVNFLAVDYASISASYPGRSRPRSRASALGDAGQRRTVGSFDNVVDNSAWVVTHGCWLSECMGQSMGTGVSRPLRETLLEF